MNRIVKQGIALFTMLMLLSVMLVSAVPAMAADEEYEPDPVLYGDKLTVPKNTPFEATFVFDHSDYSSATQVSRIDIDVSSVTSAISLGKKSYSTEKNEITWTNDTEIDIPSSSSDSDDDETRIDFGYKLVIPEKYMKRVNDKVGTLRFKITYYDKNNSRLNSFTVQKTVFDPVGDSTSSDEEEEKKPVLAVTSYSTDPASGIKEGDSFNLKVTVKNNSGVVCNNIVAAFDNTNALEIGMRGATDTLYIDSLPAQATATLTYPLVCDAKMENKNYPVSIKFTSSDLAADSVVAPRMFIPVKGTKISADDKDDDLTTSVPQIIIENYDYGGMSVTGGQEFVLSMNFRNTSPNIAIENLKMTVASAPDGDEGIIAFTPSRSSNTFFIKSVKGGSGFQEKIALYPKVDAAPKSYGVTIEYTYEAVVDGIRKADLKGTETISIPLTQPDRFEMNQVDLYGPIYMGDQGQLSVNYVNKGKSKVFNVAVALEGNFTSEDMSAYIGNVDSGSGDSFEASLTPSDVGTLAGTATITYEDSNGDTKEIQKEFSCEVIPLPDGMGGDMPGGDMPGGEVPGETPSGPPVWAIGLAVGGGVILLIIVVVIVRKKLKARKMRMLEAEDDYDDTLPEDKT